MKLGKIRFKQEKPTGTKRQWGAESRTEPLPNLHDQPSVQKITYGRVAIFLTIIFWLAYVISTIIRQFFEGPHTFAFTMEAASYLVVVTFLTFSALMYLIARQGAFERFSRHRRVPRAELERYFAATQPSITVLVPSYSEEVDVIRKTLLSAALQEYPAKRIVLLLDDKPNPTDPDTAARLNQTRALAEELTKLLSAPGRYADQALRQFERSAAKNTAASPKQIEKLVADYRWVAAWLEQLAEKETINDHVDIFFAEQVLRALAKDLKMMASAVAAAQKEKAPLQTGRLSELYRRLTWIFEGEITVFERKKYVSLSHEANKAMNLNSYIGLMGGRYQTRSTPDGPALIAVHGRDRADVSIPDSDYLLTLDADSILLRDYCLRLVYFLEQPNNSRVGVVQTPYSAFRGASTRIERLAGATTDVQHILHQGMTYYNATFWVGANAVIRKQALEDIAETETVGGFTVRRYIQDRTVIEDTESSIDLVLHGWSLVNYPERLSYSATPPDFGSLIVQRRRWANGGLLILPKLFFRLQEARRKGEPISTVGFLLRLNYMASIAWASFGLILLLAFPYDGRLLSPFVVLAALPYFIAMASDLRYSGYKRSDVFNIYGFNLILLPVNLAGVLKSLQQAFSNEKIPFARTPKVKDRTVSPWLFLVAPLLVVALSIFTLWRSYLVHNWANAAFAGLNAVLALWAIAAYIGFGTMLADLWLAATDWLYVEVDPTKVNHQLKPNRPAFNWQAVLYHGDEKGALPIGNSNTVEVEQEGAR